MIVKLLKGMAFIFSLFLCAVNTVSCTNEGNGLLTPVEQSETLQSVSREDLPSESVGETEYHIEDFIKFEALPLEVIWNEGEVFDGDISIGSKPVMSDALKKLVENSGKDEYIVLFAYGKTTCGLVPKTRLNIEALPEDMKADAKLGELIENADSSYEEYSKTAGRLLADGKKVYELYEEDEFIVVRNKAQNAYDEYYDYLKSECEKRGARSVKPDDNYAELYNTIVKNHRISAVEARNIYFSSFGFIPYFSIEFLEEEYYGYYGEGYSYDPGYVYVAKAGDILSLNDYLQGTSKTVRLYPLSKDYFNLILYLFFMATS